MIDIFTSMAEPTSAGRSKLEAAKDAASQLLDWLDLTSNQAAEAKAAGVTVFTIGVGDELDLAALERMASQPRLFYRAPDAERLAEIYAAIAGEIPCPAGAFLGGQ